MTAKEIIEKIKETTYIDTFADTLVTVPDTFKASKEAQKVRDEKNQAYEKIKTHPYNNDRKTDKDGYNKLSKIYNDLPYNWKEIQNEYLESIGIGEMKEVEQFGGEGKGDSWYSIKYFPKHNIYLNVHGFYSSYNGIDYCSWDEVKEVKPQTRTIVVYE